MGPQARSDARQEDVAEVEIEDVDDGEDITIRDDTIAEANRNDHAATSQIRSEVRGAKQTRDSQPKSMWTWIETSLPEERKAVGCKWVSKVKGDADGKVDGRW